MAIISTTLYHSMHIDSLVHMLPYSPLNLKQIFESSITSIYTISSIVMLVVMGLVHVYHLYLPIDSYSVLDVIVFTRIKVNGSNTNIEL